MEKKFIMVGCISPAKIVFQICVCSGQGKGLLRYHCLHCMLASWQGWSTGISRSQLVGTTINSEILILLWFCPEILVLFSWVKKYSAVDSSSSLGPRTRMKEDLKYGFKQGNARPYRLHTWCYWMKRAISVYPNPHHQKNDPLQVKVPRHKILQFTEITHIAVLRPLVFSIKNNSMQPDQLA